MPYNRSVDIEGVEVFLRPTNDINMYNSSSPGFSFTKNSYIEPLNPDEFEFISRRWFDIIVYDPKEFGHYKIGSITGYLLDVEAFTTDLEMNDGSESFLEMDGYSQIMCELHSLLSDTEVCDIVDTIEGDLYVLNAVTVETEFEHPLIEMAAIHLIPHAFRFIYQTEVGGIVYTNGRTELDDNTINENRNDDLYFKEHDKQIKANGFELVYDEFYYKPVLRDNWMPVDAKKVKGKKEPRTPMTKARKEAIAAKHQMAAAIQNAPMPELFGPSKKTEENTKDVLIVEPGKRPEWTTLFKERTADLYFGEHNSLLAMAAIFKGHSGGRYAFAFHALGAEKGWDRNISMGYNPLYQNIHGPIIFYHEGHLSFTEEDVKLALEHNELPVEYDDNRLFKDRKPFSLGKTVTFEDLIDPHAGFYKREQEVGDEDRKKYFISEYIPLSEAVFQLVQSGYGRFLVNYARLHERNPIVDGFKTKDELMHYAAWSLEEFAVIKLQIVEGVQTGQNTEGEASMNASRLYYLINPIEEEMAKLRS
jgi:hypothetical protein